MTVLDAIIQSLSRAGEYNRDDQVAPAVIQSGGPGGHGHLDTPATYQTKP